MGGKGSGGRRVGAGRRRENEETKRLRGSRRVDDHHGFDSTPATPNSNAANQNAAPPPEVLIPQPPGNLTLDELAEWNDLAPRAAQVGTLTPDTQWALVDLCQARVLKAKLLRDLDRIGNVVPAASGAVAANPLLARYTTLLQRVDAGMIRFKLSPMGKEIEAPKATPADPFDEFTSPPVKTANGESIN